jgi:hypothetical protein
MRTPKVRAVKMVRTIRDRHGRVLAGKSREEVLAFYRTAASATATSEPRSKPHRRKTG